MPVKGISSGLAALALLGAPGAVGAASVDLCALDALAFEAREDIRRRAAARRAEHFSLIYRGDDGRLARTPARRGMSNKVTLEQIEASLATVGVRPERMVGFVHNHPAAHYGFSAEERGVNRYPSGDLASPGDWRFARWLAEQGAGGPDGEGLFLYVVDVRHDLRRFGYAERATYVALDAAERMHGRGLPRKLERSALRRACGRPRGVRRAVR